MSSENRAGVPSSGENNDAVKKDAAEEKKDAEVAEKEVVGIPPPAATTHARPAAVDAPNQRLGIIFDIDGTLIAESRRIPGVRVRPGAVDFIAWAKSRGHAVGLWTKAHAGWAAHVVTKICPLAHPGHECTGGDTCRATFDFVWSAEQLRRQRHPSQKWQCQAVSICATSTGGECRWCEVYSSTCHQCECQWNYACPCREIKDLRKVWFSPTDETKNFVKEKTIIVEDTPQNCIYNYGNAVYVPTYRGALTGEDTFARMRSFFERELEPCDNVRTVEKCRHGRHYHACFEQSWLTEEGSSDSSLIW